VSHTKKLLIPLVLGVVAAGMNWYVLRQKLTLEGFVAVSHDLSAGHLLRAEDLEELRIGGDIGDFKKTAIPYQDKSVLISRTVCRPMQSHDIVLFQDLAPQRLEPGPRADSMPISLEGVAKVQGLLVVGDNIGFWIKKQSPAAENSGISNEDGSVPSNDTEYIGPFTLLSVGSRLTQFASSTGDSARNYESGDIIHVAIRFIDDNHTPDTASSRLIQSQQDSSVGQKRIVALSLPGSGIKEFKKPSVRSVSVVSPAGKSIVKKKN
jgi:hypothetical protein